MAHYTDSSPTDPEFPGPADIEEIRRFVRNHFLSKQIREEPAWGVDDVVQESITRTLRRMKDCEILCPVFYTTKIAVNVCNDHFRRDAVAGKKVRLITDDMGEGEWKSDVEGITDADLYCQPEEVFLVREGLDKIDEAIQALPEHLRRVMCRWKDDIVHAGKPDYNAISDVIGRDVSVARSRVYEGRKHLQKILENPYATRKVVTAL